jgi:hypothetical protein
MVTNWVTPTTNQTSFDKRELTDKGAIMDDATYTMDSLLINMDDMKLSPLFAPINTWTTPAKTTTTWT